MMLECVRVCLYRAAAAAAALVDIGIDVGDCVPSFAWTHHQQQQQCMAKTFPKKKNIFAHVQDICVSAERD